MRKSVRGTKVDMEEIKKVESEKEGDNEGIKSLELSMQKVIAQIGQMQQNIPGRKIEIEGESVKGEGNK